MFFVAQIIKYNVSYSHVFCSAFWSSFWHFLQIYIDSYCSNQNIRIDTKNIKSAIYNENRSTFLEIILNSSSEYLNQKYFKYKMIPYSAKHEMTKVMQKMSHAPIDETVLELEVGEFVVTDMKIFTMANIMVTRIPILPGFSIRIKKLTCKLYIF